MPALSRGYRRATHARTVAGPLILALWAASASAQGTGRSLDIQPGARQNGMGAAGVALASDPSDAMWWNPAALGFADRISGQFTHVRLLPGRSDNVNYYYAATAAPLGSFGGFGTSFTRLDYGPGWGTESSPAVGVGVLVRPWISLGATLKWIRMEEGPFFGSGSGETFAADLGSLAHIQRGPWRLGFGIAYQNIGGEVSVFRGGRLSSEPLSRNYKVGVSAEVPRALTSQVTIGGVAVVDFNRSRSTRRSTPGTAGSRATPSSPI